MTKAIKEILAKIRIKSKIKMKMIIEIIILNLSIQARFNFANMERYGSYTEKTYRSNFKEDFPFYEFNKVTIEEVVKIQERAELIAVGDWAYIRKSGDKSYGVGNFWSGMDKKNKKGQEIMIFSIVDVKTHQAYALEAKQTPNNGGEKGSRTDVSVEQITEMCKKLPKEVDYLVIDGAAAKVKFVNIVEPLGLHLISRLRKDANLKYIFTGEKSKQKGRPKLYEGKIDLKNIDENHFKFISKDDKQIYYSAVVYSVSFKKNIRVLYIKKIKSNDYIVLFSTDINMEPMKLLRYYKARFPIEFLIRDAKQYAGLQHCQSTNEKILNFHFNIALTSVSLAKLFYFQNPDNIGKPFSMHDVKTLFSNELLLKSFFTKFNIDPTLQLNIDAFDELRSLGLIHT